MALEIEYQKQLMNLQNVPPEVRAVRSPDALLSAYARAATQQRMAEQRSAMNIRGMESETEMARQDRREAKRDYRLALPLTLAGVGVNALGTYETRQAEKEREQQMKEEAEHWDALGEIFQNFWPEIERRMRIEPTTETYTRY